MTRSSVNGRKASDVTSLLGAAPSLRQAACILLCDLYGLAALGLSRIIWFLGDTYLEYNLHPSANGRQTVLEYPKVVDRF